MLIRISPDAEKSKSILRMAESTIGVIKELNALKFPSHIIKEYYNVLRELSAVIALLDGYKTAGEGAHKDLIDYIHITYQDKLEENQLHLLEELRTVRNKIEYDGFFVKEEYLERNKKTIEMLIKKLKDIIGTKLP